MGARVISFSFGAEGYWSMSNKMGRRGSNITTGLKHVANLYQEKEAWRLNINI